jgi:hypothetical protein
VCSTPNYTPHTDKQYEPCFKHFSLLILLVMKNVRTGNLGKLRRSANIYNLPYLTMPLHIDGCNEALSKVRIDFNLANLSVEKRADKLLADIGDSYPGATSEMQRIACKTCIGKLPSELVNYQQIIYHPLDMTPRLIFGLCGWLN